jgi:site-specific DNA-methyltransferase (adenine-specific)
MEVFNKDCLEGLKDVSKNSVDLIFCDLPYNCTKCKWDQEILDLDKLSEELWRVAKPECPIIFTAKYKFGVKIFNAFGEKNFRFDMVFRKNRASNFLNSKKMPKFSHENVLVFYKKRPKIYNKNILKYHEMIKPRSIGKKKNKNFLGMKCNISGAVHEPKLPDTDLHFTIHNIGNTNSTQKPIELIKWFLKYYSDEGFTILDPTLGSGTTAVACKEMNRKFIGFEKDKEQYDNAIKRIFGS